MDREYSQIEELLWLYRQRVLINAQIGGPLSGGKADVDLRSSKDRF